MTATVEALFTELANERGGLKALTLMEAALCRALALALCRQQIDPREVSALAALLPPARPRDLDLSRLSDGDLLRLERMLRRAMGELPPVPHTTARHPTRRDHVARAMAARLDAIAATGRRDLTPDEAITLRGYIGELLWPITTPDKLFPVQRPKPKPARDDAPAPPSGPNIVPLRGRVR
jgi:hypothetical protein